MNEAVLMTGIINERNKWHPVTLVAGSWSFLLLCLFINELSNDFEIKDYSHERKNFETLTIHSKTHDTQQFVIRIHNDHKIETHFSLDFLTQYFPKATTYIRVDKDERGRQYSKPHVIQKLSFTYEFKLNKKSSEVLKNNESLLFCNEEDFHDILKYLIKRLVDLPIPKTIENACIYNFHDRFFQVRKTNSITTLDSLINNTEGCFTFNVTPYQHGDLFFKTNDKDGNVVGIVSGIYISPYFHSILTENVFMIDGILMDTTWRVIPKYVTSILVAESYGTNIPIAFAFGKVEDTSLYKLFYSEASDRGIDLTHFIVESDQGSALRSACSGHTLHLVCLKHFITSLHKRVFGYEVESLVKSKTKEDVNVLMTTFSTTFRALSAEKQKEALKTLGKAGLTYSDNCIVIHNQDRWAEVSIEQRILLSNMPSTTNSLESIHGHLNDELPRNNNFFGALYRLISLCAISESQFITKVNHNYHNAIRTARTKMSALPAAVLTEEKETYETTLLTCKCSEQLVNSNLYRIDIPCSHRLSMGVIPTPSISTLHLNINKEKEGKLTIKMNRISREQVDARYKAENEDFYVKLAVQNIKRYLGPLDKEIITKFVRDRIQISRERVNGTPLSVIKLISEGINNISNK